MISDALRGPREVLRARLWMVTRRNSAKNSLDRLVEKWTVLRVDDLPPLSQVQAAAQTALGDRVRQGDDLRLAGYPDSSEMRVVLLVRDGRAIAEVWFEPAPGGWLASSMNGCPT